MFGIEGPVEIVIGMLQTIFGGGALNLDGLAASVETYSASAYTVVQGIHSTVVTPVAAVIISIMATLELARQSTRIDGDHQMGVRIVGATLLKVTLMIWVLQNATLILRAINAAVEAIMQGMMAYSQEITMEGIPDGMADAVREAGLFDQIGLMVVLLVPWLLSGLATVVVDLLVWIRFMEIYAYTAFAVLPLAFMMNPDTKSVAIGFLKKYATASLRGATLILVLVIYGSVGPELVSNAAGDWESYDSLSLWATMRFGALILGSVALLYLTITSGRIARALVGE